MGDHSSPYPPALRGSVAGHGSLISSETGAAPATATNMGDDRTGDPIESVKLVPLRLRGSTPRSLTMRLSSNGKTSECHSENGGSLPPSRSNLSVWYRWSVRRAEDAKDAVRFSGPAPQIGGRTGSSVALQASRARIVTGVLHHIYSGEPEHGAWARLLSDV